MEHAERLVTSIIVHWNQSQACLGTVARFRSLQEVASVIVVDNGSDPAELELLRSQLPDDVTLIEVGHNSGFGPAANRGWHRWLSGDAPTAWASLAPHDAMPEPDALARMISAASRLEKPGLLSADVGDDASPRVDHVFGPITGPAAPGEGFEAVDYPHGTLMLASRTCLQSVGIFDERYFAYCEEADLGLRARHAGFDVGLVRGARVINPQVNTPTAVVDYLKERNTVLLVFEHFGFRKAMLRFMLTIWQLLAGIVLPSRRGEYWSTTARLLAIRDILRRSWGPPPARLFTR